MKVVLLAAGRSERMSPITDKTCLPFLGTPLICHQVQQLRETGFDDICIVTSSHNKDIISQHCPNCEIVIQTEETGMKGGVLAAKPYISQEPFVVLSANDIMDSSAYKRLFETIELGVDGAIVCQKVDRYFPGGYVEVTQSGHIQTIVEKPGAGNEPSNLVNLVLHFHRDAVRFFDVLESTKSDKDDLYECALGQLFQEKQYTAIAYSDFWQPIKYPWHIFDAMNYFLKNIEPNGYIASSAKISDHAVIKGPVYIDEGVRVMEHATISGPAYIGKNSIVANNALVRDTMIGENCVVGYSTEIARSYLRSNVWTHSNYVGDSIIDNNVSFGAGSITANLRLDEQEMNVAIKGVKTSTGRNKIGSIIGPNVRVGVQSSIMPGVKIGANSVIGPGLSLFTDVPEKSFVKPTQQYSIRPNTQDIPGAR